MAFTFDPTTDRGKVRLYIGDTIDGTLNTDYFFSDASIDSLLEQNSDDIWLAAADGCRAQAARNAKNAFVLDLADALKIDQKQISKVWLALAAKYEARAEGSSANIVEYQDSYAIDYDNLGGDLGEYVGDI